MMLTRPYFFSCLCLGGVVLVSSANSSFAFSPSQSRNAIHNRKSFHMDSSYPTQSTSIQPLTSIAHILHRAPKHSLTMSTIEDDATTLAPKFQPSESSLEKLNIVKQTLLRPRGASIGVEYEPAAASSKSSGDISVLSMQLRKAKAAAIWTKDVDTLECFAKEQSSAKGDFPGPVPVIYWGVPNAGSLVRVAEGGASAVVIDYEQPLDSSVQSKLENTGIIWKVSSVEQMQQSIDNNAGDIFLLSESLLQSTNFDDIETAKEALSAIQKSAVTIATLSSMQPENAEVSQGKQYASKGISSLLVQSCCVGDNEDLKYAQFVIESISKKSSSSFSMTGLTGSTNGHFGVSSHSGEVKWQRTKAQ